MAVNTSLVNILSYTSTNVTNSAYVTLFASTSVSTSHINIEDSSGQVMLLAIGDAGNETNIFGFHISTLTGPSIIPYYIPAGSRISLIAGTSTSATTGYNVVSLIPW